MVAGEKTMKIAGSNEAGVKAVEVNGACPVP